MYKITNLNFVKQVILVSIAVCWFLQGPGTPVFWGRVEERKEQRHVVGSKGPILPPPPTASFFQGRS